MSIQSRDHMRENCDVIMIYLMRTSKHFFLCDSVFEGVSFVASIGKLKSLEQSNGFLVKHVTALKKVGKRGLMGF